MEVWLTKLETHLESHSVADTRKLLDDTALTLAAAAYQGGLLLSQGERARPISITFGAGSTCVSNSASPRCWSSPTSPARWTRPPGAGDGLAQAGGSVGGGFRRTPGPGVSRPGDASAPAWTRPWPWSRHAPTERRRLLRRLSLLHRAEQSSRIRRCSARQPGLTCSCATWRACHASWRPTATASCRGEGDFQTRADPRHLHGHRLRRLRIAGTAQPHAVAKTAARWRRSG